MGAHTSHTQYAHIIAECAHLQKRCDSGATLMRDVKLSACLSSFVFGCYRWHITTSLEKTYLIAMVVSFYMFNSPSLPWLNVPEVSSSECETVKLLKQLLWFPRAAGVVLSGTHTHTKNMNKTKQQCLTTYRRSTHCYIHIIAILCRFLVLPLSSSMQRT